jgi:hypothetical protein
MGTLDKLVAGTALVVGLAASVYYGNKLREEGDQVLDAAKVVAGVAAAAYGTRYFGKKAQANRENNQRIKRIHHMADTLYVVDYTNPRNKY